MRPFRRFLVVSALVGSAWPAHAQIPAAAPPGPFVVDARAATSGVPSSAGFYPLLQEDITVASRGLGFDVGAHVYLFSLGPSRLGIGASYAEIRATAIGSRARVRLLAPQLSFNFGTDRGWSYLSAGVGTGNVRTEVFDGVPGTAESGDVRNVNLGGGARWFVTRHAAVGFDVRFHRLAAGEPRGARAGTPQTMVVTIAVGVSLK